MSELMQAEMKKQGQKWPMVRLGDLILVKGGKRLPKGAEYSQYITGHPYIRVCDMTLGSVKTPKEELKYITDETFEKIKRYTITSDDLFISIAGSIGITGLISEELSGANLTENAAKLVIKDNDLICKKYLSWYLNTAGRESINSQIKATSQPKLALFRIEELQIPLPPLEEQKRIAAILDKADAIRRKRQQAIKLADDFLRSVFLDMFGDPVTNPKGFDTCRLEEISFRVTKGESPKWQGYEYVEKGVRFITSENVLWGTLDSRLKYIPDSFHQKLKRSQVKENDLLINLVGASVGRACLATTNGEPANVNQAVAVTTLDKEKINPFVVLQQVLLPSIQNNLLGNAVDAARANISLKNIRDIELIVPPHNLQNHFIKIVHAYKSYSTTNSELELKCLFDSFSQKAFSGEL